MKAIRVGLLGLGTVGSGVVKIIQDHQDKLMHQVGCPITIKKVLVKDLEKKREVDLPKEVLTTEVYDVIDDPDVDVVIEVIGGVEQTKQYLVDALRSKKHVVTANKDLMAVYGSELLAEAKENGCDIYFEASVAGGIPILRTLEEGLSSDRITKMMGIVNGTTNFILTKMIKEKSPYEEVLKEAQDLGFAEADPTSDVEGLMPQGKWRYWRARFLDECRSGRRQSKGNLPNYRRGHQLQQTSRLHDEADRDCSA